MNDYSITNYGIFSNGVSTTKNYNTKIDEVGQEIETCKTMLSDSSVLMGPFQEECLNEINKLNTDFSSVKTNFSSLVNLLVETSGNYQSGDTKAAETISSAGNKINTSNLSADIAAKKQAFVGNVDDASQYTVEGNIHTKRKHMRMFDNTTGEEIPEDGNITLQKGETRVITVKLPTDTGKINQIVRTTAADTSNKGNYHGDTYKITSSKSDIDPDPNNVEYVNYKDKTNHWPDNKDLLHSNYYDWIITADKVGARQISQTCEYTTDAGGNSYLKAMIGLNVKIVDGEEEKK